MPDANDSYAYPIPVLTTSRVNAKAMAGSLSASRAPLLTVPEVLNLRAVSAVVRADLRCRDPYSGTLCQATTLSQDEESIVAEAGWSEVPMVVTRFDTVRVDFTAMSEQVREAWLHAVYLLTANGFPTSCRTGWGEDVDLEVLADLANVLQRSSRPLTPRQQRWFTAG